MKNTKVTYSRDNRGILICVIILFSGALIYYNAKRYTELGAVFPETISVIMMVLSLLYIFQVLRKPQPVSIDSGGSTPRRIGLFLIMFFWAISLDYVGFLTTSLIAYALILMLANFNPWSPRSIIIYFSSGAAVVVLLYLLFTLVLNVPLSRGLFL